VFFNGSHERIISKIDERNDAVETALRMPYNDMFEIEENSISFGIIRLKQLSIF